MADEPTTTDEIQSDDPVDAPSEKPDEIAESSPAESEPGPEPEEGEPSPLEPDGKRFKQVWARAKTAEAQLQQIREDKARLEGELEATKRPPVTPETKPEPRLTWTQLEAAIEEGKVTSAQAKEYDRETLRKELQAEFERKLSETRDTDRRGSTVQSELDQYKQTVPSIVTRGTPERLKVEKEFSYLVSLGYDRNDLRTELLACRTVLGDVTTMKARQAAQTTIGGRDTMQDVAGNNKPKTDEKDPLKTLTGVERKHYQKRIDRGVYKGWSEVKEELQYVPPR